MLVAPDKVKSIASIGGGPIGAGWTASFLAHGYNVVSYLHDPAEEKVFHQFLSTAWTSLNALGFTEHGSLDRLTVTSKLSDAVSNCHFIQESAPERLGIKQSLYKILGDLTNPLIVIASSTSGLTMTDIQLHCNTPGRTVVGHPFNPPYLLPLVEITGGKNTSSEAISWVKSFYNSAGKKPLVLKKEIPGFIATRLQEALWREALHMVANEEATPEQIDLALINGPGPRLALMGQCMAFHVACGEGGMATNLDQFGPSLKLPWSRLAAPELTQELRDRMVDGCNTISGGQSYNELARKRDEGLVAILSALKNHRTIFT